MKRRAITGAYDSGYRCGDRVCRIDDERHEGVIVAVTSGLLHVLWDGPKPIHEYDIHGDEIVILEYAK
jgi:hypothetical protein